MKSRNIVFGALLALTFIFGAVSFVKPETIISETENRSLARFTHFNIKDFISGDFQNNFESAISDQFLFSEKIRSGYLQAIAKIPTFGISESFCKNSYLTVSSSDDKERGIFNCEGNIFYTPHQLTSEEENIFTQNIKKYNRINSLIDTYYYFVDDSSVMDFSTNQRVVNYPEKLASRLQGNYHLDYLKWNNFDEYINYYYKTDHHWNYRGSYQGLQDILKLLKINERVEPVRERTNNEDIFGSHARLTNNWDYPEKFVYYEFSLPEHKTYVNKEEKSYNGFRKYEEHDYEYNKKANYYAFVYGADYGEVIFDYNQPEKENLLILSNSYSNPIGEVLAQFYNETYTIDLRYYKDTFGVDFDFDNYIKKNNISKVLLILSPPYVIGDKSNQGLEG